MKETIMMLDIKKTKHLILIFYKTGLQSRGILLPCMGASLPTLNLATLGWRDLGELWEYVSDVVREALIRLSSVFCILGNRKRQ